MKTNTSLTWFKKIVEDHTETWIPVFIRAAFWDKKTRSRVTQAGLIRADNTVVFIPFYVSDEPPASGDILVKGKVEVSVEGNLSLEALIKNYPESMIVRSVDPKDYGSPGMRHWHVEGN